MPRIKWRRGLYAITDTKRFNNKELIAACADVLRGGAVIVQYRDKSTDNNKRLQQATVLRELCHQHDAFLIIDNDIDLCKAADADGVHLGPQDIDVASARNLLGPGSIIGASCHQDINKAHKALQATANYVSFGAFYASSTRPDAALVEHNILDKIKHFPIPVVAIGGINLERAEKLIHSGVDHVAIISDLWNAANREQHARNYSELFSKVSTFYDRGLS